MRVQIPDALWWEVVESGPCPYCGCPYPTTVDHDIPVSRGGTSDRANLVPCCWPCNHRKGARTGAEVLAMSRWPQWTPATPLPDFGMRRDLRALTIIHRYQRQMEVAAS